MTEVVVEWDGGHGGRDPGSSGNGVVEKDIALQVATEAAKRLERDYKGVKCLLTRSSDVYLTLKERTDKANAAGADLFISIHCNAGGGKGGFESFTYSGTRDAATAAFQAALHTEIMKYLKQFGVIDRGQKKKDLHVCRESRMPAVLTENLFVDVASDAAKLKRPEVIEAIISGHVSGVAQFLGLKRKAQQPTTRGTNILGAASATVEQAKAWARSNKAPSEFVEMAELYWQLAPLRGGIDPAIAYVQFAHETGFLYRGGHSAAGIDATYHNPCGLKITQGGGDYQASAHKRFKDWREGITAHLDHLALYAGAAGYPRSDTPDPRHFPYLHGTAKTLEQLGVKWAPSSAYGTNLVNKLANLRGVAAVDKPATAKPISETATVEMNGRVITSGTFANGLVTVQVRHLAEELGAAVGWNGSRATVNGKVIVGSRKVGDTAYAPVREIVEAAGYRVTGWDGKLLKITIQK
ncbi:N-acetylmuramoyl-L-alanine amidase [Paenibacillus alvei]|uniref:N-acetylmuramoyl-L-alanine amidase n=1 Tax=Paenibacillus alvei TaxID=44250 RepID=A0ABT4GXW7_PAEAL|nr:N-acetylmuramoyl-L-alanine amidase [Paenibacillus alvei]MCY9734615.1 N-acetylmuramoyl-L-alanine amidase [Paenibacillus alvei]MCY9755367.1 N-acetylmuramoyl-L-alanine amidase [Paenibacillus alvei]MCY9761259.1 N-acetylmuramoyl-L-alanine amidase [Paenibacillus alvei]MCY9765696.1 N-acetylmuramoyl-L-alanine amidase [Paenibacillus alvei]